MRSLQIEFGSKLMAVPVLYTFHILSHFQIPRVFKLDSHGFSTSLPDKSDEKLQIPFIDVKSILPHSEVACLDSDILDALELGSGRGKKDHFRPREPNLVS